MAAETTKPPLRRYQLGRSVPPPPKAIRSGARVRITLTRHALTMRRSLRELGYSVGRFPPGPLNAIVDVPGVRVGHLTLAELHTGVTAVLPHGGNPFAEKVLAGSHVVNGFGKATGLTQ